MRTAELTPAPVAPGKTKRSKVVSLIVSLLLFAGVAVYIVRSLAAGVRQIAWDSLTLCWGDLGVSLALALLSNVLVAESNYTLITSIAKGLGRKRIYGAILISRLGRYIPGKVASVAGAGLLLREAGVSALSTTSLVAFNTLLTCGVGMLLGLPLLLGPIFGARAGGTTLLIGAIAMLAGILLLHPRVGMPLVAVIIRRVTGRVLEVHLPNRALAKSLLCITVQWVAAGASLWFAIRALNVDAGGLLLLQCVSAASVAITFGFLALFAPGGLGVREWVFLAFLTPIAGPGPAAAITITMRLVHVGADVVSALAGSILGRSA